MRRGGKFEVGDRASTSCGKTLHEGSLVSKDGYGVVEKVGTKYIHVKLSKGRLMRWKGEVVRVLPRVLYNLTRATRPSKQELRWRAESRKYYSSKEYKQYKLEKRQENAARSLRLYEEKKREEARRIEESRRETSRLYEERCKREDADFEATRKSFVCHDEECEECPKGEPGHHGSFLGSSDFRVGRLLDYLAQQWKAAGEDGGGGREAPILVSSGFSAAAAGRWTG